MTAKPAISIIIPAYNEEAYLGRCLESVLIEAGQYPEQVAIIVVNNASSDRTKEVALAYPTVKVVDENRKGLLFARQAGYLNAKGELQANIDADTIMPALWLATVFREFALNPKLVALSGPYVYYDLSPATRLMVKLWYGLGYLLHLVNHHLLGIGAMVQGGNFIVRRSALEQIGGYNLKITFYGEDTDLARRIGKVGRVKFTFRLPMPTSGRRLRGEGLLKMGWLYGLNHLLTLYRHAPASRAYHDIRDK